MKRHSRMSNAIALAAIAITAATCVATASAGGAADPFAGAWSATDPSDGSTLRLQVGVAAPSGVRHVTVTDGFASACDAPATAIGTGTSSDSTLTATLDIRCGGELRATGVPFTFQLVDDALVGLDPILQATFVRAAEDAFTGAWAASDPFDGSSLRLQVGSPSAAGVRHVTLTDDFASACGAPATAIGTATASGSTLTTTVEIRCGGESLAEDVTIVYTLVGEALSDGFSTFTRVSS